MSNFQTAVGVQPAPAVEGDFCDSNPRFAVNAGPGGLVSGPLGLTVGRFAWFDLGSPTDPDGTPIQASNFGAGPVAGFVHREQQGLITTYLAASSMVIPAGFAVTLMSGGGFWVKNNGATQAELGMKAYAAFLDGKATFALTGAPTQGATSSASTIAAGTFSMTGSISEDILTITAVLANLVVIGALVTGTGVAANTYVTEQLTGAAGGVGTYRVSVSDQQVNSTTISGTFGLLTIGGSLTGTFAVNDVVTGSGVAAGTFITALGTGTGGAGTYIVNKTQVISSQAINADLNVETKWVCMSSGGAGDLVKISSQPLG